MDRNNTKYRLAASDYAELSAAVPMHASCVICYCSGWCVVTMSLWPRALAWCHPPCQNHHI